MNMRSWMVAVWMTAGAVGLVTAGGCGGGDAREESHEAHSEEPSGGHSADDGHGHGHDAAAEAQAPLEERVSARCEHDVPTYQCDGCRYEVGVVKLDPSLFKKQNGGGLVETQAVRRLEVSAALPTTGEVALNENTAVHISPRISGVIEAVFTDIGDRVKRGDTLLTVASVELGRALAEYDRNRTLTELAERTFLREKGLREQKVGSEQDMLDAQAVYEQQRAELKTSEQTLHVLGLTEEDLARSAEPSHESRRGNLPVRAPIDGTIIEKHAAVGEMAEPGKDVLLLADLSTVWVWANLNSRDLAPLLEAEKRGPVPMEITVSAFPDRQFTGTLDYVGATMNEATRTVKVRATVDNAERLLRPGMFCEASVSVGNGHAEEVLAAPRSGVMSDEGSSFVFKHWKDDLYVRQDVRVGREFFGAVEIVEGLDPGDTIVTDGAFLLKSDILREKMGAGCAD